jgi:hypothetical protein
VADEVLERALDLALDDDAEFCGLVMTFGNFPLTRRKSSKWRDMPAPLRGSPIILAAAFLGARACVIGMLGEVEVEALGLTPSGGTLAHAACAGLELDAIQRIAEVLGSEMFDVADFTGRFPADEAAFFGRLETVQWLFDIGLFSEVKPLALDGSPIARRMLASAAAGGHSAVVEFLLANVCVAPASLTALPAACLALAKARWTTGGIMVKRALACLRMLLDAGEANSIPLATVDLLAVFAGSPSCVQLLLERQAPVDARVLVAAARAGRCDVVEVLLAHGADVRAAWKGVTPLETAIRHGERGCASYLIEHGALNGAKFADVCEIAVRTFSRWFVDHDLVKEILRSDLVEFVGACMKVGWVNGLLAAKDLGDDWSAVDLSSLLWLAPEQLQKLRDNGAREKAASARKRSARSPKLRRQDAADPRIAPDRGGSPVARHSRGRRGSPGRGGGW